MHITRWAVLEIATYSAPAEDSATHDCNVATHMIKEFPANMQQPVIDRLVSLSPAQSESDQARTDLGSS
jgi:hypothetical protein